MRSSELVGRLLTCNRYLPKCILTPSFKRDGSQFDLLLTDGQKLQLGRLPLSNARTRPHARVWPTALAVIFVGDTCSCQIQGPLGVIFPEEALSRFIDRYRDC